MATLIRLTGDWDLAEECAQDAFAQALTRWPRDGVPHRPGGWLTTTAKNRALDRLRRTTVEAAKLRQLAMAETSHQPDSDDRLQLMFSCCHPALSLEAQVALTLRSLGGLTTAEIAHAFRISERAMGQRLFRAKEKIRHAGIPFRVPPPEQLPGRTTALLAVLYLLFNEGYAASAGPALVKADLTAEAIRLTRMLVSLAPDSAEAPGLLALMLLTDARREARLDGLGELVPLDEQDRSRWNCDQIEEGIAILDAVLRRGTPGAYQVQAAIAACHALAPDAASTDWAQIALLYRQLSKLTPNPVVELNRAVAVAMADGVDVGLAIVDALDARGSLAGYRLLPATRADLLRRLGRLDEAAASYREALALVTTDAERHYLERRLSEATAAQH